MPADSDNEKEPNTTMKTDPTIIVRADGGEYGPVWDAEKTAAILLDALGLRDIATDTHMRDTPRRLVSFLREFINPGVDLEAVLKEGFENGPGVEGADTSAMVVQTDIPFRGLCAHHLAPFFGTAAIGYIPRKRIVGLSKLARLVDTVGTRVPSTQEEITDLIADTLYKAMDALGVAVVTSAVHTCMAVRGVRASTAETKVSAVRGAFRNVPEARNEFFALLKQ